MDTIFYMQQIYQKYFSFFTNIDPFAQYDEDEPYPIMDDDELEGLEEFIDEDLVEEKESDIFEDDEEEIQEFDEEDLF